MENPNSDIESEPITNVEAPKTTEEPEPQKQHHLFKYMKITPPKGNTLCRAEQMKREEMPQPVRIPGRNIVYIDDLLSFPGRLSRPSKICIIMRGIPGSGKTHLAKLIKDKEVEMGGSAPGILNINGMIIIIIILEEI